MNLDDLRFLVTLGREGTLAAAVGWLVERSKEGARFVGSRYVHRRHGLFPRLRDE